MDDETGRDEISDEATDPPRRRGPGWADTACEEYRVSACCDSVSVFDAGCLVGLLSLTGAGGGLFAAVAGVGGTGRRLRRDERAPHGPLAAALHRGVRYYQLRLSARRPGHGGCRYTPTCSAYAAESLRRHGALKGMRLAAARLRRCRPGTGGGLDPVP